MKASVVLYSICLLLTAQICHSSRVMARNMPFDVNGRLKVIGTNLSNQHGKAIQLRGMSTHGLQYRGNCYNGESLQLLAGAWGADILRISMYIQEGGYETNPAYYTSFVDSLVNKCYEMGIYALIDWHMLHPGDPNANTKAAKTFFDHVSKKHANKGNVLYEICNEPNNDKHVVTWPLIKKYAEQIIPVIRNNDAAAIVIVGTPEFASRPDLVIGNKLKFENIMYTMHFYAADPQQLPRMEYVAKAVANGVPVFVTEFGTQDGWGDGANDFKMSEKWLRFLAEKKISWCNWNYSDSPRSGAVWKTGTCPNGPWTDENLKEAGFWIRERLRTPADDWTGNSNLTSNKPLPDSFKVKGFHLDLRVQVMKMPALKAFAKKLSNAGINTLVMEWEAAYPYSKHAIISSKYAYSREEVTSFIAYCDSLHIDVIPLQQSFGHVEYILKHYRYKELREDQKDYSQVNPLEEEKCKALFTDLYKDMIATHTSPYIHVGGDETYLLGHSKASQAKVAAVGKGRLYGDYLKMLCDIVISLGKRPIVWADIALNYPDALKLLPKETILVDWNYGWVLNRFGDHQKLMDSGFEIWGSPAIRSHPDNYFLTQWNKHFQNIETFIPQARSLGYKGMVMTSWSTSGLYSSVFESSSDVLDLHAIRRVYPLTGFNMLVEAYFQALQSPKFETASFVADYANKQYGFNKGQATAFWNALKLAPYEVNEGKVTGTSISVQQLLDSANLSAMILKALKPVQNKEEFEHYRLMADIRVMYLKVIWVESVMNNTEAYLPKTTELLAVLNSIGVNELNSRFAALNKNTLHASEIETENTLRNARVQLLKDKLLAANKTFAR